ncbi:MAG TPA: hypothetical protein VMM38_13995 [Aridibacter sp.]|nr:hypothetical protein [Aridibacter sp.]
MKTISVIKKNRQQKAASPKPAMAENEVTSERQMVSMISDRVNELGSERNSPHALPERFVSRVSRIA